MIQLDEEYIIENLLRVVGEDPTREGLRETPQRVLKAWRFMTRGYRMNPVDVLKTFEDGGERYDQMLSVSGIQFFSNCEHHMLPFFGTCTIAYIPNGRILGLSKFARVVDIYAARLQVQERLTQQIADALFKHLEPKGVGVTLQARHMCMESRGVQKVGSVTTTTSLRGVIRDDPKAREEYLQLVRA